ncbi:hypothetical protein CC86DRAFT_365764 [Ophiobolus disseminans]|uniref:Uncharacterized protein n=1 Tax=Ophiobolus disseminans TaxID=1469910 RepID=A0A6A7ALK7_9PLEO|nr:hypothetical protein CC86DRAFT_365764 [Ophiobolus disseminans]
MKPLPRIANIVAFSPVLWILNLAFLCGNIYFVVQSRQWASAKQLLCPSIPFFDTELTYEIRVLDPNDDPFAGPITSAEVDWQYENMMRHEYFRMSRTELEKIGKWRDNAIELKHGGYMAGFFAFHELHCLDWFKRDFRNPASSTFDTEYERMHVGHCVDILRQQAQCRADMTIASWYWQDGKYDEPWPRPQSPAHCVDWKAVERFLEPRNLEYVDGLAEPGVLREGGFMSQADIIYNSVYD